VVVVQLQQHVYERCGGVWVAFERTR